VGAIVVQLRHWSSGAECKGSGFDFVPTTETATGLLNARKWCDICPVRDECLTTAVKNGWHGYWGGTTTAERNRLRAPKYRAKCPICKGVTVVTLEDSQACIACGRSWRKGSPPVPRVKRLKRPTEKTAHPETEGVTTVGEVL
jgi:hypothetical protein